MNIRDIIIKSVESATGMEDVYLEKPEVEGHGDYSTNIVMQLFSESKSDKKEKSVSTLNIVDHKSPRELAEAIKDKLSKDSEISKYISKIEVAGPGFINFWLSDQYLVDELNEVLRKKEKYGTSDLGKGKTALVEYSAPNIARHFSIGHLRSTIIGQALFNTFKFLGYNTIGENHLGDWGTQFGMIMAALIRDNIDPEKLSIKEYQDLYVKYNTDAKDDPALHDEAKKWFKKLEDGNEKAVGMWKIAVTNSMAEFDRVYKILGVDIENNHGESFYEDKMPAVIKEFKDKGLMKKSQGAQIVEIEGMVPGIMLKTDGGTTYFTRDLAAVRYRLDTWSPDIMIYEVGVEQLLHFKQVFEAARMVGWIDKQELVHIPHGHYRFKGKRISTRKGAEIILEDILDEAVARARAILDETNTSKDLSEKEKKDISQAVGIGAIKYFDLLHQPKSQIDFDWDNIFTMQGNSGPYLQYTFARTQSVLKKHGGGGVGEKSFTGVKLNKEEMLLLRTFTQFPEVLEGVVKMYSPNLLCNYLFDLAQKFNNFYNQHQIIGSEEEDSRVAITNATGQTLSNGLKLLGIKPLDKM